MPASGFPGFPQEGLEFFRKLKRNNRREWFQPRKHLFDQHVKAPMVELVQAINRSMMSFAPDYVTEPSDALFRIYRDTRFSHDKTPYKTHIGAIFTRRGLSKNTCPGLYFSVSDNEIEVAGGSYMPGKEELAAIRRHIFEHHEELVHILRSRTLRRLMGEPQGDRLVRVPKGFPQDDTTGGLICYKQLYFYVLLDSAIATTPRLEREILTRFRAVLPLVEFLSKPLVPARKAAASHGILI